MTQAPPAVDNHRATPAAEQLVVTLQRTICFGRCPAYIVTIDGDGVVRWTGTTDVAAKGERRGTVARDQLARLSAAIDRARFFELDDWGRLPCTKPNGLCSDLICSDTSHSIVTVRRAGAVHEIDNAHCEPSPADALEDLIDKLANTDPWVGHR
jgi:hypothetical protein